MLATTVKLIIDCEKILLKGIQAKQVKTCITTQHRYLAETIEDRLVLCFPKLLRAKILVVYQM
jgi:hypothetical protein